MSEAGQGRLMIGTVKDWGGHPTQPGWYSPPFVLYQRIAFHNYRCAQPQGTND